jgi:RNA polymerase primary sigma factor
MRSTLIKEGTPLERVHRRRTASGAPAASRLSDDEQEALKAILSESVDFVDDPIFRKSGAERKLFAEAPQIPKPNTSWYHPVMEDLGTERHTKGVVNVVLSAEQERALFLQFNYARFRAARLHKQVAGGQFLDEQARELIKWHDLSMRLRDQIAQSNLALVLAMAKRVRHSEMDFGDLISEGNMALLRAIDKFNVARGFKFSTYACRAILKAFSRSGMKQTQYRQLFPTDFDPALERSDYQRRKFDEHETDCASEVRRIVMDNTADLTDVEKAVIHHRFALTEPGTEEPTALTLEQVGQIVGLTKERVRQIQNKALEKIRKALEASYLDGCALEAEAMQTAEDEDQEDEEY